MKSQFVAIRKIRKDPVKPVEVHKVHDQRSRRAARWFCHGCGASDPEECECNEGEENFEEDFD